MPVIGFMNGTSPQGYGHFVAAFHQGLLETGYIEGQNIAIEYRWAEGHYDRLPALAADLVQRRVAVSCGAAYANGVRVAGRNRVSRFMPPNAQFTRTNLSAREGALWSSGSRSTSDLRQSINRKPERAAGGSHGWCARVAAPRSNCRCHSRNRRTHSCHSSRTGSSRRSRIQSGARSRGRETHGRSRDQIRRRGNRHRVANLSIGTMPMPRITHNGSKPWPKSDF